MKGPALRCIPLLVLMAACNNLRGEVPDLQQFSYPTAVVSDPSGEFVYVVSTNFDSYWQRGWITPVRVDPPEVMPRGGLKVGSFGGDLVIGDFPGGLQRGYLALRDGDALAWFQIGRDPASSLPLLTCDLDGASRNTDTCREEDSFVIEGLVRDPEGDPLDSRDPFALAIGIPLRPFEQRAFGAETVRPLYAGSLQDGVMMVFQIPEDGRPVFQGHLSWYPGLHSLLEVPLEDGRRVIFGTTRNQNSLHSALVLPESGRFRLEPRMPWTVPTLSASGDYGRGMALSSDARSLYVAWRSPPALLVVALDGEGVPSLQRMVPLAGSPSLVAVYRDRTRGETVWVTDFSGDALYGVDPGSGEVIARVPVGQGPYGITVARGHAFVTNFESQDLSVVSVDPESPGYATETARIP